MKSKSGSFPIPIHSAAGMAGCGEREILRLIAAGVLEPKQTDDGGLGVLASSLVRWLNGRPDSERRPPRIKERETRIQQRRNPT